MKILNDKIYKGKNYIETVKILIENDFMEGMKTFVSLGGNINCSDGFGYTPLHWSAIKGKLEMAGLLIEMGAILDARCLNYKFTALHCAINENQNAVMELLINKGADFMARDKDGNTPLHYASMHGNDMAVQKLLKIGANVNAKDFKGITPIVLANYCGHFKLVSFLNTYGAK